VINHDLDAAIGLLPNQQTLDRHATANRNGAQHDILLSDAILIEAINEQIPNAKGAFGWNLAEI
jgi:hypothetical protein